MYDRNGQRTSISFNCTNVTAANFDAVNTALSNLQIELENLMDATPNKQTLSLIGFDPSSTNDGRRETKWLIRMRDTVNNHIYTRELGTANIALQTISVGGREYLDPAAGEWTSLQSAIQAAHILSEPGNAMVLLDVELVGRNL